MKRAFTLTELLVVIILIGILASLAIPRIGGSVNRAMETEAKVALRQVQELQKIYYLEHKSYSADLAQLGFAQEATVDAAENGTARYQIQISLADANDFKAVAIPVVKDIRSYSIAKNGKARVD